MEGENTIFIYVSLKKIIRIFVTKSAQALKRAVKNMKNNV
jgi:hypothetical protein